MIKDLFKDMGKYLPAQIVPGVVGFISIPIITRLFSPGDYGDYVLVVATVSIFSALVGWISMSIIRFYPVYERDGKLGEFYGNVIVSAIISVAIIGFIGSIILLLLKPYFSSCFYNLMWVGMLVFILTSFFGVFQYFLRAKRQVGWYSGFSIWNNLTKLGFGLLLVLIFHFGVEGLLWGAVLSIAFALPFLFKKATEKVHVNYKALSGTIISKMAKYSFPLVIGNLAAWILSLSDRYLLEFFRNSQEVGIYSASYNVAEYSIMLIVSLFMFASGPISIQIWEKDGEEKSKSFVSKVTRYYLIVCIPAVVGLSVLAKPIMSILTGKEYFIGYQIIPFIALGTFLFGLQQRFQAGFVYYKKTGFITFSIVTSGLLNLVLNFFFIPKYGYMAAALTTLVSYAFLMVLMIIVSRRFFIWEFPMRSLVKVCCASIIMGIAVYPVGNSLTSSIIINLILGIIVGVVVYTMMFFALREPNKQEIQALQTIKSNVLRKLKWQD